ncbi:hypothetical protein HRbin30_00795 [bacterium HR30]|nr:hypothetical protein HRbin30_00795 [bacterium HR30]
MAGDIQADVLQDPVMPIVRERQVADAQNRILNGQRLFALAHAIHHVQLVLPQCTAQRQRKWDTGHGSGHRNSSKHSCRQTTPNAGTQQNGSKVQHDHDSH